MRDAIGGLLGWYMVVSIEYCFVTSEHRMRRRQLDRVELRCSITRLALLIRNSKEYTAKNMLNASIDR